MYDMSKGFIMIIIEDLGVKDLGGYKKRMCVAQCVGCGSISERQYIQVVGKESAVCKSCAVTARHKSRDDYKMSETRLYRIYRNMLTRCYNKNYNKKKKANYMKNGIIVCREWVDTPSLFFKWSNENGYTEDKTIDRIDNNGNYEPSNCRWTDKYTQAQNRSHLRKDNKTGYTNVQETRNNRFSASIVVGKREYRLGTFDTALEAAIAYNSFVKRIN